MEKLRPITFKTQGKEHKGHFHCYTQEGNTTDGIGLYALVEYENGEMNYVDAQDIKFTDREPKESNAIPDLIEYEHYKGARYFMVTTATHTETGEELSIYNDVEGNSWARPLGMFHGTVERNEERMNRFERIWKVD